jgi:sugar phosphate isomerase/epimerase
VRLSLYNSGVTPRLPIAAITDEFCPNLERAAAAMAAIGMTGAELRVVFGKNVLDLTDGEVESARAALEAHGLRVVALSSPLLKCVLPDGPPLEGRIQHDVFASRHTFDDQPRLAARAFEIAHRTGARIIRVFSYWRTVKPESCFGRIVEALAQLVERASREDLVVALENEHACNVSTAAETARILAAVPNLKMVWDPANAYAAGETPFPEGYGKLAPGSIAHVHAKDCYLVAGTPVWGPLGACAIDWKGQLAALTADGYRGWVSLETHWPGPAGDKLEASTLCGWNLRWLLSA